MAEWNAGGKPKGRWEHEAPEGEEARAIQRGIDATMRDVIRDRGYNPHHFGSMADTPGPQPGSGWQDEKPLESPPGQDIIERLVNEALPHGPTNPLNDGGKDRRNDRS